LNLTSYRVLDMSSIVEVVRKSFGLSKDLDLGLLHERCVVPWAPWVLGLGPSQVVVFFFFCAE
jgi:hypothetical protein